MSDRKKALITGGNSGIGLATACLFQRHDYEVVITGRDAGRVERAAEQLGCEARVCDLTDMDSLARLAESFQDGLDVLVNNGGTATFVPIEMHTPELFDQFIHTNVRAPLFLCQYLLPALEQRGGVVVNVSSVIVESGKPGGSLYAVTKGAIDAMVRSLALEFAPRGVRVNAVSPGPIDTPIFGKMGAPEAVVTEKLAEQVEATPMKRLGTPEEVADVILAQAQSSYTTGVVWKVDGGVSAQ